MASRHLGCVHITMEKLVNEGESKSASKVQIITISRKYNHEAVYINNITIMRKSETGLARNFNLPDTLPPPLALDMV